MPLNQQWTAESIPPELAAIHDAPGGTSLRGLAELQTLLAAWSERPLPTWIYVKPIGGADA